MDNFETVSDEQLVEFVIRFDRNLYKDLIRRREKELTDYANYLVGDKKTSLEIIQNVYIEAYKNLRSFNTKNSFLIWLYKLLQKELQKRVDRANVINIKNGRANLEVENEKEIEKVGQKIKPYINRLNFSYRSIAVLHYLMNKTNFEIAEILGLSEKRVNNNVNLVRANLDKICSR